MGRTFESTKPEEYYTVTINELKEQVSRLLTQQEAALNALDQSAALLKSLRSLIIEESK